MKVQNITVQPKILKLVETLQIEVNTYMLLFKTKLRSKSNTAQPKTTQQIIAQQNSKACGEVSDRRLRYWKMMRPVHNILSGYWNTRFVKQITKPIKYMTLAQYEINLSF